MAITPKKKVCRECGKTDFIVSKGRCGYCASKTYKKLEAKPMTSTKLSTSKGFKSYKKHRDTVKEKREGLSEFFAEHVEKTFGKECQECGRPLQGGTTIEVAHILSKSSFPEVCTNENNYLYLCHSCHNTFDSSSPEDMKVFNIAKEKVKVLAPMVGVYKKEIEKFLTFEEYVEAIS